MHSRTGSPQQKKWVSNILPVVENPHLLLVTLLMCNAGAGEEGNMERASMKSTMVMSTMAMGMISRT